MGLFDMIFGMDDDKLRAIQRNTQAGTGTYEELDAAICQYAKLNNCTIQEARYFAATGEKTGSLKKDR